MRLLVSIHDVSPRFADETNELWRLCESRGIRPALLVVPSWHGAWGLEEYPTFLEWLRDRASDGAEIFLHGERHDEVNLRRGWRDELRAWGRTAREGEFLTLPRPAARLRIDRGVARLRALQLDPIGFVAPAWLWRSECRDAVTDAGLRYSEDESAIYLHERAMSIAAPVIRWSSRTAFRARASVTVAAVARRIIRSRLVRVALHPRDLESVLVRQSLLRTLDAYLERAWPTPYCAI